MHRKNITKAVLAALGLAAVAMPAQAFWNSSDIAAEHAQWRQAVATLETHGLQPAEYLEAFDHIEAFNIEHVAPFIYALSADLRYGVTRGTLSAAQKKTLEGYVHTLLAQCEKPKRCLNSIAARHEQYKPLQVKLEEYRSYAANNLWPHVGAGATIKAGMRDARVADIRNLLRLSGDLPAGTDVPNPTDTFYDAHTQAAVRSFQQRHNLEVDGEVGPATLAAMQITPQKRVEQIELTLERLRRTEDMQAGAHIIVNLPGYRLKAMDGAKTTLAMDVIIGSTARKTPLFEKSINHVVVNPTWIPTYKILSKDLLPKFRSNPEYALNGGYKIYDRAGGYELDPYSVDWHSVSARDVKVVQSSGARNALGKVKFLLPQNDSIYLHDTSKRYLFSKASRALSSGCVRLSDPKGLMEFVLAAQGDAALQTGVNAWDGSKKKTISLHTPVPVKVTYFTAQVNAQGQVEFYDDVYKKNGALARAMSQYNPQYAMREYRLAMRPSDAHGLSQYAQSQN